MTIQSKTKELSPNQPFEEVLELVQPMITSILLKCRIYKNYEYYRHIAAIAVWEAWQKAVPSKGLFSSYIYTTVKGKILNELSQENRYYENHALMDHETLTVLQTRADIGTLETEIPLLEKIRIELTNDELLMLKFLYMDGYNYNEIAKRLNLSVSAVKKRRTRLMTKLRQRVVSDQ